MADKMWDILNFLKNPSGETPKDETPHDAEAVKHQIDARLEKALENREAEPPPEKEPAAGSVRKAAEPAAEEKREAPEAALKQEIPAALKQTEAVSPLKPEPRRARTGAERGNEPEKPHSEPREELLDIPISSIKPNPFQPRKELGEQEITELAESIKELGLLQPILVKKSGGGYELIAGERRLRAASRAGLASISALVMETEPLNQQIIALVENIQRKNLSSIEEAVSLQDILTKTGWSQTELSRRMGRSQASVANKIRLLRLDPDVQKFVLSGKLGERQARSLLSLEPDEQKMLAQKAVDEDLSASALEALAEKWSEKPRASGSKNQRGGASDTPGRELLGDIAALVNRHIGRGTAAKWKVKQMDQSRLVVEITVDLMKGGGAEGPEE
ncbi:MAG: ParB/RepB/Spo0J family partition protein [Synergistaceae bacterium]|nr:ParB/RepB/Spo0J family partition protein [Synergistaceae bacterium]